MLTVFLYQIHSLRLIINTILPNKNISHFVHSFWMLENKTGKEIPSTVLSNGMVDMIAHKTNTDNWQTVIRGIDTEPSQVKIENGTKMFSIGLKLLAVEYLLGDSIKDVLNIGKNTSNDFWKFNGNDFSSLKNFSNKTTKKSLSITHIDNRKKKLFELIYSSHGSITVKELSEEVYWSSRQINRYFNDQFGISLKTYCNILRVGESFKHISEGKLYPE